MKTNLLAVVLMVYLFDSVVYAQHGHHSHHSHHGAGGYGGGCAGMGSTVYSSAMMGEAAYMYSLGQYQMMNAQANILNQQALAAYLQNQKNHAQNCYDLKRMHESWVAEQKAKHPPATKEQLITISRATTPKRLNAAQYNPATGKLSWPAVLQSETFAAHRAALEQIFAGRSVASADSWKDQNDLVRSLADHMRDQLTAQVKELRPMDFVAGKKFLDGLSRETQFDLVNGQVAVNLR